MKQAFHFLSLSSEKAAAIVALSFIAMQAPAALQSGPAAAPTETIATQPASQVSQVSSVSPISQGEDILDIRPPIHIPPPFPWLPVSAGAIAAAGLGFGAWKFLRRPRRKLPYEIALENLEKTRPLMESENAQPFSIAVSEIVRGFIEECFPVRAAHRTTNEFLRDLINLPDSPLAGHRKTLGEFLRHCDLAKFARWSLTLPQMEAMLQSASAFVIAIGKPSAAEKPRLTRSTASAPAAECATANS